MLNMFKKWSKKRNYLSCLESMDDHILSDIGLNRSHVADLRKKPFWKY
jgi:uncharacterized protein YjiS (DUF1127 family)